MSDRNVVVIPERLHKKIRVYCLLNNKKIKDFVNDTLDKRLEKIKFRRIKV